jgi:methylthioribose-1-phosphate isomerase
VRINGIHYRSIALNADGWSVRIIDQRKLPWSLVIVELNSAAMAVQAIREMWTRGAPLIGAAAAYGLCMALREDPSDLSLDRNYQLLLAARPTAVNLRWALQRVRQAALPHHGQTRVDAAYACAAAICDEDVNNNRAIGEHGLKLICPFASRHGVVNILTHCNAGALATVDYGTALAPIYLAHQTGIPIHVWVDETRPRNQGALLTAFELAQQGVPHTVIADNAGGLLMQQGKVDLCLVGADRVTRNGDVCNKIGTYLKALAAHDNQVPFYVALPYSTFDSSHESGTQIIIEERAADEVTWMHGQGTGGDVLAVKLTESQAANPAFDVTPARLISGYITERGLVDHIAVGSLPVATG